MGWHVAVFHQAHSNNFRRISRQSGFAVPFTSSKSFAFFKLLSSTIATNLLTVFRGLGSRPVRGFRSPRTYLNFRYLGEAIASILNFLTIAQLEWNSPHRSTAHLALRRDRRSLWGKTVAGSKKTIKDNEKSGIGGCANYDRRVGFLWFHITRYLGVLCVKDRFSLLSWSISAKGSYLY